jgi:hypothetical protein
MKIVANEVLLEEQTHNVLDDSIRTAMRELDRSIERLSEGFRPEDKLDAARILAQAVETLAERSNGYVYQTDPCLVSNAEFQKVAPLHYDVLEKARTYSKAVGELVDRVIERPKSEL